MSTVSLFNAAHMMSQKAADDGDIPEPAIAVSHDASPIIIVAQGDSEILINLESVEELCRLLRKVKRAAIYFQNQESGNG